jgi:hypothetical protein
MEHLMYEFPELRHWLKSLSEEHQEEQRKLHQMHKTPDHKRWHEIYLLSVYIPLRAIIQNFCRRYIDLAAKYPQTNFIYEPEDDWEHPLPGHQTLFEESYLRFLEILGRDGVITEFGVGSYDNGAMTFTLEVEFLNESRADELWDKLTAAETEQGLKARHICPLCGAKSDRPADLEFSDGDWGWCSDHEHHPMADLMFEVGQPDLAAVAASLAAENPSKSD